MRVSRQRLGLNCPSPRIPDVGEEMPGGIDGNELFTEPGSRLNSSVVLAHNSLKIK